MSHTETQAKYATGDQVRFKGGSKHFGALRNGEVIETTTHRVKEGAAEFDAPFVILRDVEDGKTYHRHASEVLHAEPNDEAGRNDNERKSDERIDD